MLNEANRLGRRNMIGLTYGEHFVISSIRRLVTNKGPDGELLDECMIVLAEDGEAGLSVFLRLLGRSARRVLEVGTEDSLFVTWDERGILSLLGAAQEDGGQGRSVLFQAHLRWAAKPLHRPDLAQAALSLARLLDVHGHRIPLEMVPAPRRDEGFENGVAGGMNAWPGSDSLLNRNFKIM